MNGRESGDTSVRNRFSTSAKILTIAGLLIVVAVAQTLRQVVHLGWPSVQAEIVSARIIRQPSSDRPGGPEYSTFRPEITYRFVGSDGQTQEVTRLVSRWSKRDAEAERFVGEHPVGSKSRISTDPHHLDQVQFDLGLNLTTFWKPLMVFLVAAICAVLGWTLGRRRTTRYVAP